MDLNNINITEVLDAITVFSEKGRHEKMHNRKNYGLSFTNDGQITYVLDGKSFVSDKTHAVILPEGQSYDIYGNKTGYFPVINFKCDNLPSDTITVLSVNNPDSIINDFEYLKKLTFQPSNRLQIMSIFYNILYKLSRYENETSNPLSPALEYAENNYSLNITNKELAKKCFLSEDYFRKQFMKEYGISPKQYVIDIRISKAKQMLTESIFKINTISEMCGFKSPNHFCRLFKQKTGVTPSEYMIENKISKI